MRLRLKKKYVELGEVISFIFEPLNGISWQAGQYINLTMPDVAPVDADRLFTIASAPHESDLLVTTYIGPSNYKQRMARLEIGEVVEADQLGGDFVWQDDGRKKLYIAGGIGVTTFRSIILDQIHRNIPNNALLLYAGKTERRPFVKELREAAEQDATLMIKDYVNTRLTLQQLLGDVPDVFDRTVYLAGSQKFSEDLGEGLVQKGIARNQIKYDYFDGYVDIEY
jgi:ferredoxin-NADP reductase